MRNPSQCLRRALRSTLLHCTAVAALLCVCTAAVRAQDNPVDDPTPRVERVTFRGADGLRAAELRASIVTQPTRCRGLLLQPICAITDWRLLQHREFLDREELVADELRLRVHYFQRGFRSAAVRSEVVPRGRGVEVIFHVAEGEPTIIEARQFTQTDTVLPRRQVRRASLPGDGDRLDLIRLSTGIVYLTEQLGERGYLDGAVHDTIDVTPDGLRARLAVVVEPGRRSTMGRLEITGNEEITDRTISNALRLRGDRLLRTSDVAGSQRSLYESNLFHEARVRVPEQADSAKVVEITVREAPPQAARIGGGFSTVEFLQAEGRYTHYNFRGGGRRLEARATVGNLLAPQLNARGLFRDVVPSDWEIEDEGVFLRPTWQASVDFLQPAFRTAENTLGLSVFAHRRIVPGIVVDNGYGAELSATRRLDYLTPVTASYRFEFTSVDAGDLYFCVNYGVCELPTIETLRGRQRMSPAAASFFSDHANHPIAPTHGWRLRAELEHASGLTLSDFRHNRIFAEGSLYHSLDLFGRRVLAGRVRAGWVQPLAGAGAALGLDDGADEFGRILHPRKRFYGGGARSVRGYRENQLGPRVLTVDPAVLTGEEGGCTEASLLDRSCDPNEVPVGEFLPRPTGGRTMLEGSVEYRFPLPRSFQGAVFVDAGLVGPGVGGVFRDAVAAVTPGFGIRMQTPVGPARIDLGLMPRRVEDLPVLTEVRGPGGERQLVRLETLRRYDPLEGASGFFGRFFDRLTLHLSIGEAF